MITDYPKCKESGLGYNPYPIGELPTLKWVLYTGLLPFILPSKNFLPGSLFQTWSKVHQHQGFSRVNFDELKFVEEFSTLIQFDTWQISRTLEVVSRPLGVLDELWWVLIISIWVLAGHLWASYHSILRLQVWQEGSTEGGQPCPVVSSRMGNPTGCRQRGIAGNEPPISSDNHLTNNLKPCDPTRGTLKFTYNQWSNPCF